MKIVLPKGRLLTRSVEALRRAGVDVVMPEGRSLLSRQNGFELIISRPSDVPTYVERFADLGIVGNDITEENDSDVFIPLKLDFGKCRICIATPSDRRTEPEDMEGYTIATKYPGIARKYFDSLGVSVDLVRMSGSIELAPSMGISDAIMDIVETGRTLRENGLAEVSKVMDVYAQVIVNRIAIKTRFQEINAMIDRMEEMMTNGARQ